MAKGEQTYSAAGKDIVHFNNAPIPDDDYDLTLLSEGLEVRRSKDKGPDAIPYIGCRFEAQGTAAKEGQKNRLVFKNFFLSLKPGGDGIIMPERGGGLAEFYRAHGEELTAPIVTKTITVGEGDEAEETDVQYLDPETVLEQLTEWADSTTRAHVGIEKDRDRKTNKVDHKSVGKNNIDRWILADASAQPVKATGTGGKTGGTVSNLKPKKK